MAKVSITGSKPSKRQTPKNESKSIPVPDRETTQIEYLNSTIKKQQNQIDNLLQKNKELERVIAKMKEISSRLYT